MEWQISEIVTDFPSSYTVTVSSYPVTTSLGQSLGNGSYFGKIYVSRDGKICDLDSVNFDARRSQNILALEQISLKYFRDVETTWLFEGSFLWGFILSVIYIWFFTIRHKRPIWEAAVATILAPVIYVLLTQVVRPYLYTVGPPFEYFGDLACDFGTVTFTVTLLRVHYDTLIIMLLGILAELGALGIMIREMMAAIRRKESSKSAVG